MQLSPWDAVQQRRRAYEASTTNINRCRKFENCYGPGSDRASRKFHKWSNESQFSDIMCWPMHGTENVVCPQRHRPNWPRISMTATSIWLPFCCIEESLFCVQFSVDVDFSCRMWRLMATITATLNSQHASQSSCTEKDVHNRIYYCERVRAILLAVAACGKLMAFFKWAPK